MDTAELRILWEQICSETENAMTRGDRFDAEGGEDATWCDDCGEPTHIDDVHVNTADELVCQDCINRPNRWAYCDSCEHWERYWGTSSVSGHRVCQSCIDSSGQYHYCENCDETYHEDDESHDHEDGCSMSDGHLCEAEGQEFWFTYGEHTYPADTRFTIGLPAGTIDEVGMDRIRYAIIDYAWSMPIKTFEERKRADAMHAFAQTIMSMPVGAEMVTKEGKFPRRLTKHAYKTLGLKLPADLMTTVGNIAHEHSNTAKTYHVETTRDLNMSAADFYHEDSCWWQSYSESRCYAKSNGTFGLRAFDAEGSDIVAGRVWVQPFKMPCSSRGTYYPAPTTHTTVADGAFGFLIYNGYGELTALDTARIIAHANGMGYKKVGWYASPMYINGETAYMVAPTDYLTSPDFDYSIEWAYSSHNDLYVQEHGKEDESVHTIVEAAVGPRTSWDFVLAG